MSICTCVVYLYPQLQNAVRKPHLRGFLPIAAIKVGTARKLASFLNGIFANRKTIRGVQWSYFERLHGQTVIRRDYKKPKIRSIPICVLNANLVLRVAKKIVSSYTRFYMIFLKLNVKKYYVLLYFD